MRGGTFRFARSVAGMRAPHENAHATRRGSTNVVPARELLLALYKCITTGQPNTDLCRSTSNQTVQSGRVSHAK